MTYSKALGLLSIIWAFYGISVNAQVIYERPSYDHKWAINNHLMDVSDTTYNIEATNFYCQFKESNSSLYYEDTGITYTTNGSYIFSHQGDTIPGSDSLAYHPSQGNISGTISAGPGPDLALMLPGFDNERFSVFSITVERILDNGVPGEQYLPHLYQTKLVRTDEFPYAEVIEKKKLVFSDTLDQGLSAVRHANGRDWWIVLNSRNKEEQFVLLYDIYGVHYIKSQDLSTQENTTIGKGKSLFSPSGNLYAKIKYSYSETPPYYSHLLVYEFDRCTGNFVPLISHQDSFPIPLILTPSLGLGFSSNSRFLYVSDAFALYQFDLFSDDITSSRSKLFDYYNQPEPEPGTFLTLVEYPSLTPNGEILVGGAGSYPHLHKVANPNQRADTSSFIWRAIVGLQNTDGYFPNIPHYSIGPLEESPCDTLGINYPPPISNFEYTINDSTLEVELYNTSSIYTDSWFWELGDNSSASIEHLDYTYQEAGSYEVCLTVTAPSGSDTYCDTLYVGVEEPSTVLNSSISKIDLRVHPNPVRDLISIELPEQHSGQLYLIDMHGRILESIHFYRKQSLSINLQSYTSGTYFLKLYDFEGREAVEKIIKF